VQIDKGKSKMKNITDKDIVSMGGSEEGIYYLLKSWKNTMPDDQQYRELQKNSIEAVQRVQKENPDFKGEIKWCRDSAYYKSHKVSKLCIEDNGDGMSAKVMVSNLNNLGASIRKSQHLNFGCGAKVAVLSKNHKGLITKSWVKGAECGYLVLMSWSENKVGMYKEMDPVTLHSHQTFPIKWDQAPDFIKKTGHGTVVTLLGDTEDQDTTVPTEAYLKTGMLRASRQSTFWLVCYLNTKFYSIPQNIEIMGERFEEHEWKLFILGHEKVINKHTEKKEQVRLTGATAHVFYSDEEFAAKYKSARSEFLIKGQVALVSQDEVIKLDFDGSPSGNTLPKWGLQALRQQVILIIKPDGSFVQNPERTQLRYNGQDSSDFITAWSNEFKEKMPEWLKTKEHDKEQEQLKNNDYTDQLKKWALFFKTPRYKSATNGEAIEEGDIRKASSKGNGRNPNPNPDPTPPVDRYGETKELFGVKIDQSQYKGKKVNKINEYPECAEVHRGKTQYPLEFVKEGYRVEVNVESIFFDQIEEFFYKNYKKVQKTTIRTEAIKLVKVSIVQQVAYIHNRLDVTEEEKDGALGKVSLAGMAANIGAYVFETLRKNFDKMSKKPSEEPLFLPLDDSFIHNSDPSKHVSNNSRK